MYETYFRATKYLIKENFSFHVKKKKKKTHKIIVTSFSFTQGLTEDYSLGDSHSVTSEETALKRQGKSPFIYDFWLRSTCIQAYILVKLTANHKEQISQVNAFSAFLWMGRCKNLGLLKLFLRYTSNQLRGCLVKAQCAPSCSSSWTSPLRQLQWLMT